MSQDIRVEINRTNKSKVVGVSAAPTVATRLGDLKDVDATLPRNDETLVYEESTGKYNIKVLPTVSDGTF
jgi:hypothetical protein